MQKSADFSKQIMNRYLEIYEFEIFYYSENNLEETAKRVCRCIYNLSNTYRASSTNYKIENNQLTVFVKYKTFVLKTEQSETMGGMKIGLHI